MQREQDFIPGNRPLNDSTSAYMVDRRFFPEESKIVGGGRRGQKHNICKKIHIYSKKPKNIQKEGRGNSTPYPHSALPFDDFK
jgi:hypothetical protein